MQKLLIQKTNYLFLSLLLTLFSHVLGQVFIVEPLVGDISVPCVGGCMVTFSSLRMEISLSCLYMEQTFPSSTAL